MNIMAIPDKKEVKVQWIVPPGADTYVNQLLAQYDGTFVHLMFAQVNPPFVPGATDAERQELLDKISSVPAIPIGRFVVPLENIRTMVDVLQKFLEQIDKLTKP
jgi:hypothetical protein